MVTFIILFCFFTLLMVIAAMIFPPHFVDGECCYIDAIDIVMLFFFSHSVDGDCFFLLLLFSFFWWWSPFFTLQMLFCCYYSHFFDGDRLYVIFLRAGLCSSSWHEGGGTMLGSHDFSWSLLNDKCSHDCNDKLSKPQKRLRGRERKNINAWFSR